MDDKWLPMHSAPLDGSRFLVYAPGSRLNAADPIDLVFWVPGRHGAPGWFQISPGYGYWAAECTHWQPLPQRPTA